MDGFRARYIHRILGVSPAFISRVSNTFVLKQLAAFPLSTILLERQLTYFGQIASMKPSSSLRRILFQDDQHFTLREPALKRGRPRDTWGRKMLQEAIRMTGSMEALRMQVYEASWKSKVKKYCRQQYAYQQYKLNEDAIVSQSDSFHSTAHFVHSGYLQPWHQHS